MGRRCLHLEIQVDIQTQETKFGGLQKVDGQ